MHRSLLSISIVLVSSNVCHATEAQETKIYEETKKFILKKISLEAQQKIEPGVSLYNEDELKRLGSVNKTISEVLQLNPNVQFSQDSMSAAKLGEIKANDFSINGAMVYDNQIMLDNISLNNVINPVAGNNDFAMTGLSGSSVATTINTDLLCELAVFDSNVSAEYGEFLGGVVKAKTCAPKTTVGKVHGQIIYDYTSNDWTNSNHIDENEIEDFEKESGDLYQKNFTKHGISANLYSNLTDRIGMNLNLSKRQSDINVKSLLVNHDSAKHALENESAQLNIYGKLNEQHKLKVGLQFQNDQKSLDQYNVKNGHVDVSSQNKAMELELSSQLKYARMTQSFVFQKQDMLSDSASNEMIIWRNSKNKDWSTLTTATEGGYGDQAQGLNSVEYKIKSEFHPFQWFNAEHNVLIGAGYGHYDTDWQRLENVYNYFVPTNKDMTNCLHQNGQSIDPNCDASYNNGQGQYHTTRVGLNAGSIEIRNDHAHFFIEDAIQFNDYINLRLGLRTDYDSLNSKTVFSPRSTFQYLPFSNQHLKFTTGWNRYYANKLFAYYLKDGINNLSYRETRKNIDNDWGSRVPYLSSNIQTSDLVTPYVDESMFAIDSRIGAFDAQLKYVHRNFKDQIRKTRVSISPIIDEYDNLGRMQADTYTFTLTNHQPISFKESQHSILFAFDHTDKNSNFTDYDDVIIPSNYQQYILYDNKIIDESTRPANNYNRPWTARLAWNIDFQQVPLKLSNQLRLKSSYDAMVSSTIPVNERPIGPDGNLVKTRYDLTPISSAFTWDMRASYNIHVAKDYYFIWGLTIKNLTNKINRYTLENSANLYTESGRQFIADVSFKF